MKLSAPIHQQVLAECFRVLRSGGTLVICDSLQLQDCAELDRMLEVFPQAFNEPYYGNYIRDDFPGRLRAAGFEEVQTEVHGLSKYFVTHKPA